jgi:hypothetical protein
MDAGERRGTICALDSSRSLPGRRAANAAAELLVAKSAAGAEAISAPEIPDP